MTLLLVWGQPAKGICRKTLNQSHVATLPVLIDPREAITDALVGNGLASVEIIPA